MCRKSLSQSTFIYKYLEVDHASPTLLMGCWPDPYEIWSGASSGVIFIQLQVDMGIVNRHGKMVAQGALQGHLKEALAPRSLYMTKH